MVTSTTSPTININFFQEINNVIQQLGSMLDGGSNGAAQAPVSSQPSIFSGQTPQQPILPINPQTGMFDIGVLAGNPAFGGQQPIYGFPQAGAALMPTHTLYNFGAGMYNLISKYTSAVYRQPLSVTLGMMNGQNQTPFGNDPMAFMSGLPNYVNGAPTNGSGMAPPFMGSAPMFGAPAGQAGFTPYYGNMTPGSIPSAPLGTPGLINQNYISPIGSNLAPIGKTPIGPGGVGYTGTLGESIGFGVGSAFRSHPTASSMNSALMASPYGQMYPDQYNSGSLFSKTIMNKPYSRSGVTGLRKAGDGSGLTAPDVGDGQKGIMNLIGKYSGYLY